MKKKNVIKALSTLIYNDKISINDARFIIGKRPLCDEDIDTLRFVNVKETIEVFGYDPSLTL